MEKSKIEALNQPIFDKKHAAFQTADGFANFVAKLGIGPGRGAEGTEDNLLSKGHYEFNLLTRNRIQLEAAYRGSWIVGQVIDTVAEDMTRAEIDVTTNEGAEEVDEFKQKMRALQIWQSLCDTVKWSRLYGGAIAVMQIEGQKLETPLRLETVGKDQFKGLVVYDRWQLFPVLTNLINSGPNLGLPAYYDIVLGSNLNDPGVEPGGESPETNATASEPGTQTMNNTGGRIRVHHSRCIRMEGHRLPFWQAITEMMWGESVLERMWDRLISFDTASLATGNLITRASLRTVSVEGLREILGAGGKAQENLVAQFTYMRELQQNEGITLLDATDIFASTAYSFAGLPDVLIQFGQQVSGSAQIPLVRLFGQSPTGLNSNGESDLRQYYDGILQKQEAKLRNPLTTLLKVIWQSMKGAPAPKDLSFEFAPLWQMSATDKATIAKTNTDTIIEAHDAGGIDTATMMKELKQTSGEHGIFTHISDEAIDDAENEEPPQPELTAPGGNPAGDPGEGPVTPKTAKDPLNLKTKDSAFKIIKGWLIRDKKKAPVNDPGIPGTMKEFEKGTLKSSSGEKVTSKKQALAIGYSEEGRDSAEEMSDDQRIIREFLSQYK